MQLNFEFPADIAILEKIGEIIATAGQSAGFGDSDIYDIQLAVDEACTNTITHGLKKDPTRTFHLIIEWERDNIEIIIRETGEPFDLNEIKEPDLEASLEERAIGGLGFYFVKNLMDEVDYHNEKGVKILRMVKKVKQK